MSAATETPSNPKLPAETGTGVVGYLAGIRDVLVLDLKRRLRSRGWYILLGIWFALTGVVSLLTWAGWNASQQTMPQGYSDYMPAPAGPGSLIFEVVLAFVLLFGLLVAPALSANAVNGDRSAGTLAILQITLLTPGQILWGKFLAAWLAALAFLVTSVPFLAFGVMQGGMTPAYIVVSLFMLAAELGVVCAIGVGISALAGRPLFSIVVTYLAVAGLVFGTLIAFGLGVQLSLGTVQANTPNYGYMEGPIPGPSSPDSPAPSPAPVTPSEPGYTCAGPVQERSTYRTERVAWVLAMNPYVVVADAIPYPDRSQQGGMMYPAYSYPGMIESISQGARYALAGPEQTYPCANGVPHPQYLRQGTPLWPLGLGLQLVLAGLLVWLGWRALRTPAHRLARGTRIA